MFYKAKKNVKDVDENTEDSTQRSRQDALQGVLNQIERFYGKGSIQKLGDSKKLNVETISSGSLTLDLALGILHKDNMLNVITHYWHFYRWRLSKGTCNRNIWTRVKWKNYTCFTCNR